MNHPTPSPADESWWIRLLDHLTDWHTHRQPPGPALRAALRIPPKPATALILTTATLLISVALVLAWWLLAGIGTLVMTIADAIRDAVTHTSTTGGHHLADWSVTRTITDPVHTYLTAHATGLPVTAHTLWITWLVATCGLLALATAGSRGARYGWCLHGATTTAMVYTATPADARALAAGLTITLWALLAVAAFNRLFPSQQPPSWTVRLRHRPHPTD